MALLYWSAGRNKLVVKMKTKNSIYPTHVFHCHQAISSIFVKRHLNNHFPPYSFDLIDNITWCRYRNVMKTCDGTRIGASLHNGNYWVHKVRYSYSGWIILEQKFVNYFGNFRIFNFEIFDLWWYFLQCLWDNQIWKIIRGWSLVKKWQFFGIYKTWK